MAQSGPLRSPFQPSDPPNVYLNKTGLGTLWALIKEKFASKTHTQDMSTINGLQTALADKQAQKLVTTNVSVATSAWVADSTYSDYPKAATISIAGVTADMVPEVIFAVDNAISGNFAPTAESSDNGIKIYAKETPTSDMIIPTIILWR